MIIFKDYSGCLSVPCAVSGSVSSFSLLHCLKDCETHQWLMRLGSRSGSPERGEQKVHHQRTCPGRKHHSAMLQHLLRALPCVEQSSRLAFFSCLKKSCTELMHFSQLWSWPLGEWREGDVPPLPFCRLDASESLTSFWMKGMCKDRMEQPWPLATSVEDEDGKREDVSALDCHLFQH